MTSEAISLPYAEGSIHADTRLPLRLLEPRWPAPLSARELDRAFPETALRAFLRGRRRITILLPDQTRRCGASELLRRLAPLLKDRQVTLLTANGIHPPMPPGTLQGLYGKDNLERWPLVQHDADGEGHFADLGVSPLGNPIRVHRLAAEADAVLALSSISFHYFAGFGGGRKLLLPGVASRESLTANHRMVISRGVPGPGILRGNPLHAEMRWVEGRFRGRLFHLIAGLGADYRIAGLWGGRGGAPLLRAARWLRDHHAVRLEHRYPFAVISCGGAPKDINLIQAHKSLEFAHRAVEPGGILLFAAACAQGIGSSQFLRWFRFSGSGGGEEAWKRELIRSYEVGGQTALRWHMKSRSHRVWMLTELSDADFLPLGATRLESLQEGLGGLAELCPGREGLLIPHAASVLPFVSGA